MNTVFNKIRGGLIVSCQALPDEPLHSDYIMSHMAYAAMLGGALGIRTSSVSDITAIKKIVELPVIGIIKKKYADSDIFITPTLKEVDEIAACGCEIIAMDATDRLRPYGETLKDFFKKVRDKYPEQLFMADCSTFEEAESATEIGFDCVGTTMSGYTPYSKGTELPNLTMIRRLREKVGVPVIAEGGIWTPDQLVSCFEAGAWSAVVGTAITRPREITRRFVDALGNRSETSSADF